MARVVPSLLQCCKDGYWFCTHCERVVPLLSIALLSPARCPVCRRHTANWYPPVFAPDPKTAYAN